MHIFFTSLFMIGQSNASPNLRGEVMNALRKGKCEKAKNLSIKWVTDNTHVWQNWQARIKAVECNQTPIDEVYLAYRKFLWYGGKKTPQIAQKMKAMYPKLFDLRVRVSPPTKDGRLDESEYKISLLEKPWAQFEKKSSGNYLASNLLPGSLTVRIDTKNPNFASYEVPVQTKANEEYEVTFDWPTVKLYVPKSDPRIQAKVKLPTEQGAPKILEPETTIDTIAGNIFVIPNLKKIENSKVKPYSIQLKRGHTTLPLPWGYEVFVNGKLIARQVLSPADPVVTRNDIKIPIRVGANKISLPSRLTVTPQYGQIQKFVVNNDNLQLGSAIDTLQKAQKQLKKTLKPQVISYSLGTIFLLAGKRLDNMAQNSALVARGVREVNDFEIYEDEVFKAKLYRGISIGGVVSGLAALGVGISMTAKPATEAVKGFRAANQEISKIGKKVINLNDYAEKREMP